MDSKILAAIVKRISKNETRSVKAAVHFVATNPEPYKRTNKKIK